MAGGFDYGELRRLIRSAITPYVKAVVRIIGAIAMATKGGAPTISGASDELATLR